MNIWRTAAFLVLFASHSLNAAEQSFDIGRDAPGSSLKDQVPSGDYTINIRGTIDAPYRIEVKRRNLPIGGLTTPGDLQPPFSAQSALIANPTPCQILASAVDVALETRRDANQSEAAFFRYRRAVEELLANPDCTDPELTAQHSRFQLLIAESTITLRPYALEEGQLLEIKIVRIKADGKDGATWTYELATEQQGEWQASWGLGLIPDRDETFFSKATNETSFEITKRNHNTSLDPAAAIFYTWLGNADRQKAVVSGPTAGLGLDKENLMVFAGWNWTYRQNIGASVGVVVHKQTRLAGQFQEGQSVKESLSADSLQESVYRPNLFIGITMRFGN